MREGGGDCREARNTRKDSRPPAQTIFQGQEELARFEMKMIGKPYAGELHVRFDEGEQDIVLRTILNGHEVGNDRYSQEST